MSEQREREPYLKIDDPRFSAQAIGGSVFVRVQSGEGPLGYAAAISPINALALANVLIEGALEALKESNNGE